MSSGRAFLVYTTLRIALLLAVGGLLYLTGARGFLLIVLAFLLSGALSLVWLDRPRAKMSEGFGRAIGKVNDKIDAAAAAEDDLEDLAEDEPKAESETGQQKS